MSYTEKVPSLVVSCLGVRLVRRITRFRYVGEMLDDTNDARTAQLDNRTSQRGTIRQVRSMTIHCFYGGKQYTESSGRRTGEILLAMRLP